MKNSLTLALILISHLHIIAQINQNWEDDSWIGNWSVSTGTGIWEVGVPTSGPNSAYEGTKCLATVLAADYLEDTESLFESPLFQVPDISETPRLRFWHWFSFNLGDYGQVQIKPEGGDWETLSLNYTYTSSNAWTLPLLDMSAYAGQTVQIGFFFHSENVNFGNEEVRSGWYIDDIEIVTGDLVFNTPEGFEDGIGDWSAERGTWQVGTPTSGPDGAYSGANCAATVLDANYRDEVDSRLVSSPVEVPQASETPRLRFWHWFSFNLGDYGQVQIKPEGGDWETISLNYTYTSSSVWTLPLLDMSAYAGQIVQIGFFFHSENVNFGNEEVRSGWYIDDIEIVTGDLVFNTPEGFEDGIGDWFAERGTWQVGTPTSGPDSAYSGANCAATVLDGNYRDEVDSRLVTVPFSVPDTSTNPRIRFWHWYSFNEGDAGYVEIKVDTSDWQTILGPYTGNSDNNWRRPFYDLTSHIGSTVQVAFRFESNNINFGNEEVSSGWYIDDFIAQDFLTLPPPEWRVRKTGTTPVPGRNIDYFITIENTGDATVTDLEVGELVDPFKVTLQSLSPPSVVPDSLLINSSLVYWTIPELEPGDFRMLSYSVRLHDTIPMGDTIVGGPICAIKCLSRHYLDITEFCFDKIARTVNSCLQCVPFCQCGVFCSVVGVPGGQALCLSCLSPCLGCLTIGLPPLSMGCVPNSFRMLSCMDEEFDTFCKKECDEKKDTVQIAIDPNEKLVNAKRYIQSDQLLVYPIHFENIGTVEAIDVFLTDTLSENLDLSTLEILTPDSVSVDTVNRIVRWELLDRNLQPEETDNVLLAIKPMPDLPSGTEIRNTAEIQFDIFDPFLTNEVINIIDDQKPVSQMDSLPPVTTDTTFAISWTGVDSIGEIDNYTIFVSVDEGEWTEHFLRISDTTAIFSGKVGKTYSFISIAEDVAGNVEEKLPIAEATTFIDPSVAVISPESNDPKRNELLRQNFPNPFKSNTSIEYSINGFGRVNLEVYDVYGSKVKTLIDANQVEGKYNVNWDGRNDLGVRLNGGMYFYRLIVNDHMEIKKMVLVK